MEDKRLDMNLSSNVLKAAFIVGAKRLEENKDYINELNVFPVPDGDTGTNMSLTVNSALKDITAEEFEDPQSLCKVISQGSLRGARGNSGVILSQLFRGFYKVIKTSENIDMFTMAQALSKATETAYRAVMKPKEGTILTVAKAISDRAMSIYSDCKDMGEFYDELVDAAETMLLKTPDLLPVLKQAGVVDSGGQGLVHIMKGAADYINGRDTDTKIHKDKKSDNKPAISIYDYEISLDIIPDTKPSSKFIKDMEVYMEGLGKVVRFEAKEEYIHLKIMTSTPGKVISRATKSAKIDNVNLINKNSSQNINNTKPEPPKELKEFGFVSVSMGDGFAEIFSSLDVDVCINGGQTMNPSTEDILSAIDSVYAKHVFVLPNNKNILLAANQAAELTKDKKVCVIPTTTTPQGISAMIGFSPDASFEDNQNSMNDEIGYISSGEITYAVRDTIIDDKEIKEGDFMGIGDGSIKAIEKNLNKCVESLVKALTDDDSSLLSLYYGSDVTEADAKKIQNKLSKKYPKIEIELQYGGQPVYYYVLSVE